MQVLFEGLGALFNSNLSFCILAQPHTLLQRVKACTSEEDQEKLMQITSLHSLNAFLLPIKTVGVQVQGSFQGCSGSCFPAGAACGETSLLLRGWEYRAWLRKGNWRCCASLVLCGCRAGVGIPEQVSARGSLGQCPAQGLLTHSQLLQPPELCCHPAGPAEARECSAALGKNPSFLHLDVVVALSSAFLDCANPSPWEGRSWSGAGDTGISAAAGFPSLSLPVGTGTHTRSRC